MEDDRTAKLEARVQQLEGKDEYGIKLVLQKVDTLILAQDDAKKERKEINEKLIVMGKDQAKFMEKAEHNEKELITTNGRIRDLRAWVWSLGGLDVASIATVLYTIFGVK